MLRPLTLAALLPLLLAATPFDWPHTPAAHAARDYFAAYAKGSEAALRAFDARYRAPANDAVEVERMAKAKAVREAIGAVEPIRVDAVTPNSITIVARSSVGADLKFEFDMVESNPSKLDGIAMTAPDGGA
jgi:hypothetical protein